MGYRDTTSGWSIVNVVIACLLAVIVAVAAFGAYGDGTRVTEK